jgi:AraC-type DNA-binding domain-containing proteins
MEESGPAVCIPQTLLEAAQRFMLILTFVPIPPLSMFVDYFWYMEGYNSFHTWERTLPDGSADAIFVLQDESVRLLDRRAGQMEPGYSVLCGPHSDYYAIDTAGKATVIGIHFKPGGARPFLKEPLQELLNSHVPLDAVWGAKAGSLREELLAAQSPEGVFRVMERGLLSFAFRPLTIHPAVRYALNNLPGRHVMEVVDRIGLSHRAFNQMFKETVGMTPKVYSRILRFQHALDCIARSENIVWTDIALSCGYYDQAHFIKDFQSFSGINPSDYQAVPGRHRNHIAL